TVIGIGQRVGRPSDTPAVSDTNTRAPRYRLAPPPRKPLEQRWFVDQIGRHDGTNTKAPAPRHQLVTRLPRRGGCHDLVRLGIVTILQKQSVPERHRPRLGREAAT